jgi:hypothetical protein
MKAALHAGLVLLAIGSMRVTAQEASSGVDLRATLTAQMASSKELTEAPRSGSAVIAGSRAVAYPTIKFNEHWFVTGAMQVVTRPYYYSDFSTQGYGAKGAVLQATLNYSRVSGRGSVLARAGEMSTAFGSFLLRYDDADNALIDLPPEYGYYYSTVSFLPVTAAQVDATRGKWDGRFQFANSSPANPRSPFARDQYGNWAAGGGYTIRQGLRIGISGYRGPYLDRKYAYYFPGEANPNKLPAHAIGVDGNWAHGHTSAYVEAEVRQVLSPRWFIAGRYSIASNSATGRSNIFEGACGFRPDRFQLLKVGYEEEHFSSGSNRNENIVAVQFITLFHKSAGR